MTAKSDLKKRIRARQAKTGESYTAARQHVLRARDEDYQAETPPHPERLTGVVLKCNEQSLRLRVTGEDGSLTLRCSSYDAWHVAPAQFVDVNVTKRWIWRGDAYASGGVERTWTDISALGLEPLPLKDQGLTDISEIYEPILPPDPYAEMWAFFASTPRTAFTFDIIAWGAGVGVDLEDHNACLVADAAELMAFDRTEARELLMEALLADPRCIDAHVHLGNMAFDHRPQEALVHYEIAVAIGELSLSPDFSGMLPWGYIHNRPFLRALHGYGLCHWRLDRPRQAREVFERILSLNPNDNQGVRICWDDIRNGHPWRPEGIGEDHAPVEAVH